VWSYSAGCGLTCRLAVSAMLDVAWRSPVPVVVGSPLGSPEIVSSANVRITRSLCRRGPRVQRNHARFSQTAPALGNRSHPARVPDREEPGTYA